MPMCQKHLWATDAWLAAKGLPRSDVFFPGFRPEIRGTGLWNLCFFDVFGEAGGGAIQKLPAFF